jgi:O-antigen/teichoic acid export membrane protein
MQKNFLYYLLPSIVTGGLSVFIMIPVTTYYLNPKDFGVFAILNAITMPIGPLSSTGANWVLAGNYFKISDGEKGALVFNILLLDLLLKLFWVVLFLVVAPLLLPIIIKDFEPRYTDYFMLVLVSILLTAFWPTISYFIVLQQRARLHTFFEISQWVSGALVIVICLTFLKMTTITLFLGPIAAGMASLLLGFWYMRSYVRPSLSRKWISEVFRFGLPTIPSNFFEMLSNFADRYFVQRWISLSQLGIYSHSMNYRDVFKMGSRAFIRSYIPSAIEAYSKKLDTSDLAYKLKTWYGLLAVSGLFATLFSYEIVNTLTHGKFTAAAALVPIWFLMVFSLAYGVPYTQFLLVQKKNIFMVYSGIAIGIVSIGVTAFSIYEFGILGAVFSIVLSNFAIQLSRRIYAEKLGCGVIAEKEFFSAIALLLGVYLGNALVDLTIIEKAGVWILLAVPVAYFYGLIAIIKTFGHKVYDYLMAKKHRNV